MSLRTSCYEIDKPWNRNCSPLEYKNFSRLSPSCKAVCWVLELGRLFKKVTKESRLHSQTHKLRRSSNVQNVGSAPVEQHVAPFLEQLCTRTVQSVTA